MIDLILILPVNRMMRIHPPPPPLPLPLPLPQLIAPLLPHRPLLHRRQRRRPPLLPLPPNLPSPAPLSALLQPLPLPLRTPPHRLLLYPANAVDRAKYNRKYTRQSTDSSVLLIRLIPFVYVRAQ